MELIALSGVNNILKSVRLKNVTHHLDYLIIIYFQKTKNYFKVKKEKKKKITTDIEYINNKKEIIEINSFNSKKIIKKKRQKKI